MKSLAELNAANHTFYDASAMKPGEHKFISAQSPKGATETHHLVNHRGTPTGVAVHKFGNEYHGLVRGQPQAKGTSAHAVAQHLGQKHNLNIRHDLSSTGTTPGKVKSIKPGGSY